LYLQSGGTHSLADYYTSSKNAAKIDRSLQKHIVFADHSLVTDTVFSETHLISCRNVLIYFNRELQNKVFGLFYESLRRRCFLGLGPKETVQFSEYEKKFATFVKPDRILQKI
ncbi:MAG: protein-glutamate O-methyltransferase CheR, partial [Proteobacteria bacterium]|nr:protein-glutamate O-methyltransferase CheR [Pseudomonadota bacterium]